MTRERKWLVGVCLAACLAAAGAGWDNSATNDEPYFTLGAYAAVEGQGFLVAEHPPLYKLAAGLPLRLLPLRSPDLDPGRVFYGLPGTIHTFLHENSLPGLMILRVARLGMLIFLPVFLWGAFRLGELLAGARAGLAAAVALACQPLVLGHAFVVHTDVPAAACWVWACVFLERFLGGERSAWLGLGIWVGLALAAKHSGVLLVLILVIRVLAARLGNASFGARPLAGAMVVGCLVPLVLTGWTLRRVPLEQEQELVRVLARQFPSWPWAGEVLLSLAALCKACSHWLLGLTYVMWNSTHGQGINYFWGQLSPYGFTFYFPVALLVKLSLPFTLLWLAALVQWRVLPRKARWLWVYVALYLVAGLGSAFNIGARHLMPVVGWLAVLAGWTLAQVGLRLRVVAFAALMVAPVVAFPHYISHFSLLVGGPRGGEKILHDSNLDWGQDWARLAKLAKGRGWRPLYALYLGADDPSGYGVGVENLMTTGRLPVSGYVAVSSATALIAPHYFTYRGLPQNARYLRALLQYLERCAMVGKVGDSITVYNCEAKTEAEPGKSRREPTPKS